jgi:hypothetical protein
LPDDTSIACAHTSVYLRQPWYALSVLSSLQGGKNWRASSARSFSGDSVEMTH